MLKRGIGLVVVFALLSVLFVAAMASAQDGEEGPIQPWEIAQKGGYNVIAIHEEVGIDTLDRVHALLTQEYGDKVLYWTVQEIDGVQHVYAYPYREGEDAKTFVELIERTVNDDLAVTPESEKDESRSVWVCNHLYWHAFYLGSVVSICGYQGTGSHGYGNLAVYSFDNVASSYYETNTSGAVAIYDGYNYTSYIGTIVSDWGLFNSTYNDKASSVWGYY